MHDYGCTLKAFRTQMVRKLNLYSDMHRFLPALCWRGGARVTEVVVSHRARTLGTSKYGLNRIFKVVVDLIVIKLIVGFADRPVQYFGTLSLGFLGLALLAGGLWGYNLVEGWKEGTIIFPTVVILFFCSFFYFLLIGFLADMIVHVAPRDPAEVTTAGVTETY